MPRVFKWNLGAVEWLTSKKTEKYNSLPMGRNVISALRTNKQLGQAVEIKLNWVYFSKKIMGLEMLKMLPSVLGLTLLLAYPFPTKTSGAPWLMETHGCPLPPDVLEDYRDTWAAARQGCAAHLSKSPMVYCRQQASCQLITKCCGPSALCFVSSVENSTGSDPFFMEMDVCNVETDPFLIREDMGVERCSAQIISTNST